MTHPELTCLGDFRRMRVYRALSLTLWSGWLPCVEEIVEGLFSDFE
jgi:hypothetical protein